ncbi:DUF262 domain-containing protein [Paenibacillus psychroresistens]|uniref:DUF262 domain-containing protein n=1 Tax=Paenibacillus psychroresistens TaxID=1778678 RepID=A0A6B8RQ93_9BACL|nr:DUF262 domain-containing protein [Paenibacillus psychroresistens]QGQ97556.1 DUF262 domain-containing protein [Paenibacillus psychroresistens]
MKASETKLQQIFEGIKQYVVPLFQRQYSWDIKQWGKLWDDLIELSNTDNPRDHFIGSIVTMPTSSVPEGVAKYVLIDGQQRLTTIFILLVLIRDKLVQINEKLEAEELNNTLIVNQYKKGTDHFKLLPTQIDRISFEKLIKEDESQLISNSDQITKAYEFFERKFKRSNIDVQVLKKTITNNLSIVSIVLDSDDNPYLVFESLNATGRPLTQSDLIRNYFFMQIHTDDHEKVFELYWKPMQYKLGDNLTEFIRHYLMKDGLMIGQNDVYLTLKEKVNKLSAINNLKEIATFAKYYEKLLLPNTEEHHGVRNALKSISRLESTTVFPFILKCYHDFANKEVTSIEFIEILNIIENFLIRRFVCNYPSDRLKNIFPSLYSQVTSQNIGFITGLKRVLQTKGYPKDADFKVKFLTVNLYGGRDRAKKTRLILEKIEKYYGHKEEVQFDEVKISIEHIMPQTLTEPWQDHLGEGWDTTHELYLHTLGNLTLTAYNSELSNDNFEKKKARLNTSHFELNKYFFDIDTWKKEDIEKRAEHLANISIQVWSYFGDENYEQSLKDIVTGTTPRYLWMLGQNIVVNSWRDVFEQTMNLIAELEPDLFEQLIEKYPRFIGPSKSKFREFRRLKNNAYIEVNLSAKEIQRFCVQAIESIELSIEDWKVEVV